jgi:hypothetical protein
MYYYSNCYGTPKKERTILKEALKTRRVRKVDYLNDCPQAMRWRLEQEEQLMNGLIQLRNRARLND